MNLDNKTLFQLLNCNNDNYDFTSLSPRKITRQRKRYFKYIDKDFDQIHPSVTLDDWYNKDTVYPNIHPAHQKVVDTVDRLKPLSVCEIGAGAGVVSKYVYNVHPEVKLTCIEPNQQNFKLIHENFKKETKKIKPAIDVKAEIINCSGQKLPLEENSIELIYTCTVLMHIPFLMIPDTVSEISRVSSKYILHVENQNDKINAVHMPSKKVKMDRVQNKLQINYETIYSNLGFSLIEKDRWKDPYADCDYVSYLYKKNA